MIPQSGIGRCLFFLHIALIAAQWIVPLAVMFLYLVRISPRGQ